MGVMTSVAVRPKQRNSCVPISSPEKNRVGR